MSLTLKEELAANVISFLRRKLIGQKVSPGTYSTQVFLYDKGKYIIDDVDFALSSIDWSIDDYGGIYDTYNINVKVKTLKGHDSGWKKLYLY